MNRLTRHNTGSLELEGATSLSLDGTESVDGVSERVNNATEVTFTDSNGENLTRAGNFLSGFDSGELSENNGSDLVLVEVEGEAQSPVGELDEFVGHHAGESVNVCNSVTSVNDVANFLCARFRRLVRLGEVAKRLADVVRVDFHFCHGFSLCAAS
ncbi:unannotated protein [freshwater metagenome]|uniref:Unannotated protein n=1 Tax=freshwater metagenome TaxID=449393 RepID=A0A6J6FEB3_9ZZZZ